MTRKDKLKHLAKAARAMRAAVEALKQVADDKSDNHYLCPDARYYQKEIQELLSCDHEQAGLDALIRMVALSMDVTP